MPRSSKMRLQRYLAQAGVASRRQAETLIAEGRVRVNGEPVEAAGVTVDPARDRIEVDGRRVVATSPVYRLMLKPRGCLATLTAKSDREPSQGARADGEGGGRVSPAGAQRRRDRQPAQAARAPERPTLLQYLHQPEPGLQVVAPLDFPAEGVLLLTTDGELAQALSRPGSGLPMTYHLKLQGKVPPDKIERLRRGWRWEGRMIRPASVDLIATTEGDNNTWIEMTVAEARARALKAAGDVIRHFVLKISRVRLGALSFEPLRPGGFRDLTKAELLELRMAAGLDVL